MSVSLSVKYCRPSAFWPSNKSAPAAVPELAASAPAPSSKVYRSCGRATRGDLPKVSKSARISSALRARVQSCSWSRDPRSV
eukprot:245717-Prymnesium_polylepis.2